MGEETPIEKLFKLMDKNGDGYVSRKARRKKYIYSFKESNNICYLLYLFIYSHICFVQSGISTNLQEDEQRAGKLWSVGTGLIVDSLTGD